MTYLYSLLSTVGYIYAMAIDPAGNQYNIDYANVFTHAHLRLASISLTKLSGKL